MSEAQIDPRHYDFARYVDIRRWASYWHQVQETLSLRPQSVLEIGVGTGLFRAILQTLHCPVESVDINAALRPDHVASVTALPLPDDSFSAVVAFQVLEHLPYEDFRASVSEMRRVAAEHVILSLPDARKLWRCSLDVGAGERRLQMPEPRLRAPVHKGRGQHKWEIGKRGYPPERIAADLRACGLEVLKDFRAPENPYHHFFVCRKSAD